MPDAVKKLTTCMERLEKQNRNILSRLEFLETSQYDQSYIIPPPWYMGCNGTIPPTSYTSQSFFSTPPPSQAQLLSTAIDSSSDTPPVTTSSSSDTPPAITPNRATGVSAIKMKENTPLPPINRKSLISPQAVVEKYPKLLTQSKVPALSIRLAQEAFFGKELMSFCTFKGVGSCHALPETEVKDLREFLLKLTLPGIVSSRSDFEILWKRCIESIGQSCKSLRKLRLANLELN